MKFGFYNTGNQEIERIEIIKMLNGYENIDRNIYLSVNEDRRTRGHEVTLAKVQWRPDTTKSTFHNRTVN